MVKSPWISFFQSLATGSSFQRVVYAGDNISRFICHSGAMPRPANHTFPRPEWLMLSTTFNGWLLLLRGDCSPPCRARLPTSQAATVCATDLRWPPWAETTSPAAFSSSIPFCRMLSAALMSRSCSIPHSGHRQMRL